MLVLVSYFAAMLVLILYFASLLVLAWSLFYICLISEDDINPLLNDLWRRYEEEQAARYPGAYSGGHLEFEGQI